MSQLWQAAAPSTQEPDSELLIRLAGTADALMAREPLEANQEDMEQIEAWLAQPAEKWLHLIQQLPQEQWLNLAIFFTVAEEQTYRTFASTPELSAPVSQITVGA